MIYSTLHLLLIVLLIVPLIPMIIFAGVIILITVLCSEVKAMSILTAIFQAIGQAIAWILPISESGHSAVFHDFSARYTNACSQLTGVIHIGIAIGIIAAFYKLFIRLAVNFFSSFNELFHKRLNIKSPSPQRKFMYMTILSFTLMIFYLIPVGRYGNVFMVFHRTTFNGTLLGEGICMALTGILLFVTSSMLGKKHNPLPPWAQALVIGVIAFLAIPTSGCSLVAGIFCLGVIVGMSDKYALRYSMVMSVMVLLVAGVTELVIAVTSVSVVQAIISLVISALVSFFAVKVLIFVIKKNYLKQIAIYDFALGAICLVIGIFEIVVK